MNKNHSVYFLFICCIILAVGLLGREIYVPSLPELSKEFSENSWLVPSSLTAFLIGMGVSQLVYGPLSDIYGRKKILLFGIIIYLIGNIATCFVASSEQLWLCRLFAGVGAGVCPVIPRVILCDIYQNTQLTKAMSWLAIFSTVTPAAAPILGGYLHITYVAHRPFIFLSILTVISFFILLLFVPETHVPSRQNRIDNSQIRTNFVQIVSNRYFIKLSVFAALNYAMFIAYTILSPYFFQNTLGLSPLENGYLYCFVVLGYLVGAIVVNRSADFIADTTSIMIGLAFTVLGSVCLLLFYLFGEVNSIAVILPMMIVMVGSGMITPVTTKQSINLFPEMSGTAAALFGSIRMLGCFLLCLPLVSIALDEHTLMLLSIGVFTLLMCVVAGRSIVTKDLLA